MSGCPRSKAIIILSSIRIKFKRVYLPCFYNSEKKRSSWALQDLKRFKILKWKIIHWNWIFLNFLISMGLMQSKAESERAILINGLLVENVHCLHCAVTAAEFYDFFAECIKNLTFFPWTTPSPDWTTHSNLFLKLIFFTKLKASNTREFLLFVYISVLGDCYRVASRNIAVKCPNQNK